MHNNYITAGCLFAVCFLAFAVCSGEESGTEGNSLAAFPGAEGFGAVATGGRGGRVIKVTSLKASGPGSFKWACNQKGPRIVVFDVSGVIDAGGGAVKIGKFSNLTVAGQTAPGAGITVNGFIRVRPGYDFKDGDCPMDNVIMRFIRTRPNFHGAHSTSGDGFQLTKGTKWILDHASTSWSTDEAIQFSVGGTVQWSACEGSALGWEGHHHHNYGPYFYATKHPQTFHHSLIAHATERCPAQSNTPLLDMRNVVVYNCQPGVQLGNSNAVGNYLKEGPGGPQNMRPNLPPIRPGRPGLSQHRSGKVYASGNVYKPLKAPAKKLSDKGDTPIEAPTVTTHSAEEAYEMVMAHAGCLPRDAVSKKTFKEARTGTGFMGRYVPKEGLMEGMKPGEAPKDSDSDGMPDDWEKAHKLDPNDPADNTGIVPAGASENDRHKGYTYIEYYINECADKLIEQAIAEYRSLKQGE